MDFMASRNLFFKRYVNLASLLRKFSYLDVIWHPKVHCKADFSFSWSKLNSGIGNHKSLGLNGWGTFAGIARPLICGSLIFNLPEFSSLLCWLLSTDDPSGLKLKATFMLLTIELSFLEKMIHSFNFFGVQRQLQMRRGIDKWRWLSLVSYVQLLGCF